ncbi:MAG: 3-methyl-2-oxobutanoate dehydrogenase subunit beta, partial [Bacteroidales bacterium]|nr:3-methyl-2-oxobutanoate dehydrogenase subunit beta [Bacteroidales bacterium]
ADIIETQEQETEDAEIIIVAYGSPARSALSAVKLARKEGIKAGLLRLITVWPFPDEKILEVANKAKTIIVPEINRGQIVREVERCSHDKCHVISLPKLGDIHTPYEILKVIKEVSK